MAHDRADRRDMWQERQEMRKDERDLHHDYAAQRAGMNEQGDISRDQADMRADRRQIVRDRADMRADERDMRSDRQELRADGVGTDVRDAHHDLRNVKVEDVRADRMDQRIAKDWEPAGERATTDARTNAAPGMGVSQRGNLSAPQTPGRQPGVSPTALTSNATSESNKSPATQTAHQAWYRYLWPW
jgi:hypothetical protein